MSSFIMKWMMIAFIFIVLLKSNFPSETNSGNKNLHLKLILRNWIVLFEMDLLNKRLEFNFRLSLNLFLFLF